jgi:hypothetical protein
MQHHHSVPHPKRAIFESNFSPMPNLWPADITLIEIPLENPMCGSDRTLHDMKPGHVWALPVTTLPSPELQAVHDRKALRPVQ